MDWVPLVAKVEAEPRATPGALAVARSCPSAVGCRRCGLWVVFACDQTRVQTDDFPRPCVVFPHQNTGTRTFAQNGPQALAVAAFLYNRSEIKR